MSSCLRLVVFTVSCFSLCTYCMCCKFRTHVYLLYMRILRYVVFFRPVLYFLFQCLYIILDSLSKSLRVWPEVTQWESCRADLGNETRASRGFEKKKHGNQKPRRSEQRLIFFKTLSQKSELRFFFEKRFWSKCRCPPLPLPPPLPHSHHHTLP